MCDLNAGLFDALQKGLVSFLGGLLGALPTGRLHANQVLGLGRRGGFGGAGNGKPAGMGTRRMGQEPGGDPGILQAAGQHPHMGVGGLATAVAATVDGGVAGLESIDSAEARGPGQRPLALGADGRGHHGRTHGGRRARRRPARRARHIPGVGGGGGRTEAELGQRRLADQDAAARPERMDDGGVPYARVFSQSPRAPAGGRVPGFEDVLQAKRHAVHGRGRASVPVAFGGGFGGCHGGIEVGAGERLDGGFARGDARQATLQIFDRGIGPGLEPIHDVMEGEQAGRPGIVRFAAHGAAGPVPGVAQAPATED